MITVLSPAKTLDFDSPIQIRKATTPDHLDQSKQLVNLLKKQTPADLSSLMGISEKLGELNAERYREWRTPFTGRNARQSVLAFKGDVYIGLAAEEWESPDFTFAQKHLRILSGLYGVLRPLDLIQPYRLEMGTKLPNRAGQDLYAFWGDRLSRCVAAELGSQRNHTLINLASKEYFGAINAALMPGEVITPVFKDYKGGTYRILSFFAKKARGAMASYIVRNRIDRPEGLKDFDVDGYQFNPDMSDSNEWVFTRKAS